MDLGWQSSGCNDGDMSATLYWDVSQPGEPFMNGPEGYALKLVNRSGGKFTLTVTMADGTVNVYNLDSQKGDPVIRGKVSSQTAAQLAALGFTNRAQIRGFDLSCN